MVFRQFCDSCDEEIEKEENTLKLDLGFFATNTTRLLKKEKMVLCSSCYSKLNEVIKCFQ